MKNMLKKYFYPYKNRLKEKIKLSPVYNLLGIEKFTFDKEKFSIEDVKKHLEKKCKGKIEIIIE